MKRFGKIIWLVGLVLLLGTSVSAAELKTGFMDYSWGESIAKFSELTKLSSRQDVTYYSNPAESYTIDDIAVNDAVFGFYKGQFFAVYIGIDAPETYDAIKSYMQSKYGLPDTKISTRDHVTTMKWKHGEVAIKLKSSEIDHKMKLAFYYTPLSGELNRQQLEATDESSYRFFPIDKNKRPRMIPFLEF